ncbi:MAG: radical SAM protein, partial [Candidatus Thorarchaeota archaeon]
MANLLDKIDNDFYQRNKIECKTTLGKVEAQLQSVFLKVFIDNTEFILNLFPMINKQNKYYFKTNNFYYSLESSNDKFAGNDISINSLVNNYAKSLIKYDDELLVFYREKKKEAEQNQSNVKRTIIGKNIFSINHKVQFIECRLLLTNKCNQKCLFCCYNDNDCKLLFDDIKTALDKVKSEEINNLDKIRISITGGEPTVSPYFFETLNYIKRLQFPYMSLQTNGIKFADRIFVKKTYELGIREITFS